MSSQNIRLKRLLATQLRVYKLDEYRTSKLNYKTKKESNNLYFPVLIFRYFRKCQILYNKMSEQIFRQDITIFCY